MLLELLALAGGSTKKRTTGDDQVLALAIGVLLDQEVLLLVTDGGNDLLGLLAKEGQYTLGLTIKSRHGTQKRSLLVKRLAGVGAEGRGDTQNLVLDESGARAIPCGIATGLKGGT